MCVRLVVIVTRVLLFNPTKLIILHLQLSTKQPFQTRFSEALTST